MKWNNWKSLTASLAVPSIAYLLLFFSGWLRSFEYSLYDLSLRLRPSEPVAPRMVIVGITEEDLQRLNQNNIDDGTLARVIKTIKAHNPRVIGLDFHRNVPVCFAAADCQSDSQELAAIFRDTPNLIGVEKTTGSEVFVEPILPHPELARAGRTGDSAVIEDPDRVIRRAYLDVQKSSDEIIPSFSLVVALKYLEQESIQPIDYKTWLRLNDAIFPEIGEMGIETEETEATETESNPLFKKLETLLVWLKYRTKEFNKFYPPKEIDNYQILLNYRANRNLFEQISVFELLEQGSFGLDLRDKIVLIGRVDELSKDYYDVPHIERSKVDQDYSFGVTIHAQLVSYLVEAALEGRTVFRFLPTRVGNSLIILLLLEPLVFIYWLDKKKQKALNLLVLAGCQLSIILGGGWLSLYFLGYWLPTGLFLVTTSVIMATLGFLIYNHRHEQEKQNLAEIIEQKSQELKLAYKKIMAQSKIFTYQGLAEIVSHELKNKTNTIKAAAQDDERRNLPRLKQMIDWVSYAFEEFEDEEGFIDPRNLCESALENNQSILQSVQKISLVLQELDRDSGRDALEVSPVNLNESLKVIINDLARLEPIEFLQINVDYDETLPELTGIKQHLERALENIIANAFDSLRSKSQMSLMYTPILNVATANKRDSLEIRIRDNGKGIPLGSIKQIFQMHWTSKIEAGGKGLGLFFAQEFIHEHGGDINVESKLGEFAEFIIRLPKS